MSKYLTYQDNGIEKVFNGIIPRYEERILWTNPNPTATMGDNIAINLASDDYDYLIWIYCYNNTVENNNIQKSSICMKGSSVMMNVIGYSTGQSVRRVINYISPKKYTSKVGYYGDNTNSAYCIPLYVIAGKYST